MDLKLNVGCGNDYREGFINIDGSDELKRVDRVIKIPQQNISEVYGLESIDYILCNDFLEHHFHFEALDILFDFFKTLKSGGILEVRIPDCKYIILTPFLSIETKLTLLFGGQDIPQGNQEMDISRKKFPHYFCHKYGWTKKRFKKDSEDIGFKIINIKRIGTNLVFKASK